jgi:hypothetical protein
MSELLETTVSVDLGRRRGKLTISFATLEDLQRVLGVLAPDVRLEGLADSGGTGDAESPAVLTDPVSGSHHSVGGVGETGSAPPD